MNTKMIMARWQRWVQKQFPDLYAPQARSLACFSFAAASARHCHLSRLAAHVPSKVQPLSVRRRLMRLLGNSRLDVDCACEQMASWLRRWNSPQARLRLLLDETPFRNQMRVLKVSVAYRRRALPLVWRCYPLKERDSSLPDTVEELLTRTHEIVQRWAPRARVIVLADRGFCWPRLIRWFNQRHEEWQWDYLIRAKSNVLCRPVDPDTADLWCPGAPLPRSLAGLVTKRGKGWCGRLQVFRKANWLECNVVCCWPREAKDGWHLMTSLPPTLHACRNYARRIWQEQSFRDEKSHGFCWHLSHVTTVERANRLLLILALAQLWLMEMGVAALTPQWRQRLGLKPRAQQRVSPSTHRIWSCFRAGWHLLHYALNNQLAPPIQLTFAPP